MAAELCTASYSDKVQKISRYTAAVLKATPVYDMEDLTYVSANALVLNGFKNAYQIALVDDEEWDKMPSVNKLEAYEITKAVHLAISKTENGNLAWQNSDSIFTAVQKCRNIRERDKNIFADKIAGLTNYELADKYSITSERVRQICSEVITKTVQKFGDNYFEDRFRYAYSTYAFQTGRQVFPEQVLNYFAILGLRQGTNDFMAAMNDPAIQKDKVVLAMFRREVVATCFYAGGRWYHKTVQELEQAFAINCCDKRMHINEYAENFNRFLDSIGVYENEFRLHKGCEKNMEAKIRRSLFYLCSQGRTFRHYDVKNRDAAELVAEIGLDTYNNTEISAITLFHEHSEVMTRYGILDGYELHDFLKKTITEGSGKNKIHFVKMPYIVFGNFDRKQTTFNILKENSPVDKKTLIDIMHNQFGYEHYTVAACLQDFVGYYDPVRQVYDITICSNETEVSINASMDANRKAVTMAMKDMVDECCWKAEFRQMCVDYGGDGDACMDEAVLKDAGLCISNDFVYLDYYSSLKDCFFGIINDNPSKNFMDINSRFSKNGDIVFPLRKAKAEMIRSFDIVMVTKTNYMTAGDLYDMGISKNMMHSFCQKAYETAKDGTYFNLASLKEDGFRHEIFDMYPGDKVMRGILESGLNDIAIPVFGTSVFYKEAEGACASKEDFLLSVLSEKFNVYPCIGTGELIYCLETRYGIDVQWKRVHEALKNTGIYYDRMSRELYRDHDAYVSELRKMHDAYMSQVETT